jgi:hypothetical protein
MSPNVARLLKMEDIHRLWKTYYSKIEYVTRFIPGKTDRQLPLRQNGDRIGPDGMRDVFHFAGGGDFTILYGSNPR